MAARSRWLERLAEAYFRPKAFELDGRLWEWMGVVPFKKLLVSLGRKGVRESSPSRYLLADRSREGIAAFERRTRYNELVHLVAVVPSALALLVVGLDSAPVAAVLVVVLVLNVHPLVLQRYNRIRIERVLSRWRRRRAPA